MKAMNKVVHSLLVTLGTVSATALLLTGCNTPSGKADNPTEPTEPVELAAPALTVESIKQFRFDWPGDETATHYRILENPDGQSGFTDISGTLASGTETFQLDVPLHARINATYILQRCDSDGCSDSPATSVSGHLNAGIGYFKPDIVAPDDYYFGRAVAISGDGHVLAVTGGKDVYIFTSTSQSSWQQQQKLTVRSDAMSLDLSEDGSRMAAGTPNDSMDAEGIFDSHNDVSATGVSASGAVYLFTRNGVSWEEEAYIKASNNAAVSDFGGSISLSGDGRRLAVGSYKESNDAAGISTTFPNSSDNSGKSSSGAVYLYLYDGAQWQEDTYIKASNVNEGDFFGSTVSLSDSGNRVAVGAPDESNNATGISTTFPTTSGGKSFSGAVYVYRLDGSEWVEEAYIKASNAKAYDRFGVSTSISNEGDVLAIGAWGEPSAVSGPQTSPRPDAATNRYQSGAAYVYRHNSAAWAEEAFIKAGNSSNNDRFGWGVAISGNGQWLAIIARDEDSDSNGVHASSGDQTSNAASDSGAAYVYRYNNALWAEQSYIKSSNNRAGDIAFGYRPSSISLSNSGDHLVVGAMGENSTATGIQGDQDDRSGKYIGAVYLY